MTRIDVLCGTITNVCVLPVTPVWRVQGSFGTLYKGTYCGQDVAVKILRDIQDDPQQYEEFAQVRRASQLRWHGEVAAHSSALDCAIYSLTNS